jgi:hypothetical protein
VGPLDEGVPDPALERRVHHGYWVLALAGIGHRGNILCLYETSALKCILYREPNTEYPSIRETEYTSIQTCEAAVPERGVPRVPRIGH